MLRLRNAHDSEIAFSCYKFCQNVIKSEYLVQASDISSQIKIRFSDSHPTPLFINIIQEALE